MKNKILINVLVPYLMEEFEIFIPVNERISRVKELIVKSLTNVSGVRLDVNRIYSLLDPENGTIYDSRLPVRDTNITNSKKLILY